MAPEPWDPGLQNERTRLAWVRTATLLAVGGLGGVILAFRGGSPPPTAAVFAIAALCGAALLLRTGSRYTRVQRDLHEFRPLDHGVDGVAAWIGTLSVAVGAFVLVFVLAR